MTKDEQIEALKERLNQCLNVIDSATDTIEQWFPDEEDRGDIYFDLISELAPTEELLMKIEKLNG